MMIEVEIGEKGQSAWWITNDPVVMRVVDAFGVPHRKVQVPDSTKAAELVATILEEEAQGMTMTPEVEERFNTLESGVAQVLGKLDQINEKLDKAPAPAPAYGGGGGGGYKKAQSLSNVQTGTFRIEKIWDDKMPSGSPKWNIDFKDGAGQRKKIGTFKPEIANVAKEAALNSRPVELTFGLNAKGFPEIVSLS